MSAVLPSLFNPALNVDGSVEAGAKLYVYEPGTLTPKSVYSDSALSVPHANPVVADASGRFETIYIDPSDTYRFILKTFEDLTLPNGDIDNYSIGGDSSLRGDLADTTGAALVGLEDGRTVQDYVSDTPVSLSYGKRLPLRTNRQAVAAIADIPDELVGFADYAGTTGGQGFSNYYVNDVALTTANPYSLGSALEAARTAGGGNIYFDTSGSYDVVFTERFFLDEDYSNLTIYAPGRNVTFWCDRLDGLFLIHAQNIIFKNIYFRTLGGAINGTVLGEEESRARTIVQINAEEADKIAFIGCEFRHPSWHCLDATRITVGDGSHLCRVSVQNCIFWDHIQGHLIGTNNAHLDPGDYTSNTSTRCVFVTFYETIWAYGLQRNPKALGQSHVDMVNCYTLLRPYEVEYLDGSNTYPEVHTDVYGAGVQEGGWVEARGCLFQSAHTSADAAYATALLSGGYSGNTGRISVEDCAAENDLILETNEAASISALPYTLAHTAVPAAGTLRDAFVMDLWANAGARADAAPEGEFVWVETSTGYPNGETVLMDMNRRTDRSGYLERVDVLAEYKGLSDSPSPLIYTPQATARVVGKSEGRSTGDAIGSTMLDISDLSSSYLKIVTGTAAAGTVKHIISSVDGVVTDGLELHLYGSSSEPITIKNRSSMTMTVADTVADTLTITGHGEATSGFPVTFRNSGGALPGGIEEDTRYYGVYVDANTIKIAPTYEDAVAETNLIDVTSAGTGTQTALIGSFTLPDNQDIVLANSSQVTIFIYEEGTLLFQLKGSVPSTSGIYTPTVTGISNTTSVTASEGMWKKDGQIVTVAVEIEHTATASSTDSVVQVSLPIASDITIEGDVIGNGASNDSGTKAYGPIYGAVGTDKASYRFTATTTAARDHYLTFTYRIR